MEFQGLVFFWVPFARCALRGDTRTEERRERVIWYSYLSELLYNTSEFRAKGNPFSFPLVLRKKLREFPSQTLFGLREISQTETAIPLGRFARE